MQQHNDEYIVPEPNYLWLIDDHVKLNAWDIEIYTAIDTYLQKIIWIYVKISAHIVVSVLQQYVDTLKDEQVHSFILKSDHGVETSLIASAYHEFVKKHDATITFKNCYYYEISVKNTQVEKWWRNLTES